MPPSFVLTIAGTDPSGAAGIQADSFVIQQHGLPAASVITAVLAQNTCGVQQLYPMSAAQITAQLDSALGDLPIAAIKIGLVPTPEAAEAISAAIARLPVTVPVVLDPVLSSGDGRRALVAPGTTEALAAMLAALAPRVRVWTPNAPEAAALSGLEVQTGEQALRAAATLSAGGAHVLLKAGHLLREDGWLRDVWGSAGEAALLEPLAAIPQDVRGTGCHLSSALAAQLALGSAPREAALLARRYLGALLHAARWSPGHGRMIIQHGARTREEQV
jgi:hydroxymethylpyrimidine/phosphomethylpyrimidine kinase